MLKKAFFYTALMLAGIAVFCVIGVWMMGHDRSLAVAITLDRWLEDYVWAFRIWRYSLYALLYFYWPRIGRWVKQRDSLAWNDQDSVDWNHYRYRLMIILVGIDVVLVERWPEKFLQGMLS